MTLEQLNIELIAAIDVCDWDRYDVLAKNIRDMLDSLAG